MASPLLTLQDITLGFGGRPLFRGIDLALGRGERIALVGRNGSGKSTLLKVMADLIEPDAGQRVPQQGIRIAYLPQEPDLSGFATVMDYIAGGLPADQQHETHKAGAMLDALTLDGGRSTEGLSGGEIRRAAIVRALIDDPDIVMLDEPTNHLDLAAIEWLEQRLGDTRFGLIVISHDRAFLERVTNTTLWLDQGRLRRLDKGFAAFEEWSQTILEREATETAKLDKLIAQETVWSHQGITARRKRNQGRLRRLADLRTDRAGRPGPAGQVRMASAGAGLAGKLVVEAETITKAYDGRAIIKDFSTRILRGDRVGLIGPNGAGKTTLLRLLIGELAPDSGTVRLGTKIEMVYLDQTREALEPGLTPWRILCPAGGDQVMVGDRPRHVVSYLRDFLFAENQARSPVESLSGGERNRLLLARALAKPSNLLILDEPTNDLDMDTLDLLQEMIADYAGTVMLVSHDRDFLDRTVTSTIAIEGDGATTEYPGGYSDYLRQRPKPATNRASRGSATGVSAPAPDMSPKPLRKLGYKQQRALEELPSRIDTLESHIASLGATLSDSGLYARDRNSFERVTADLAAARDALSTAENEWLELQILCDEIESKRR